MSVRFDLTDELQDLTPLLQSGAAHPLTQRDVFLTTLEQSVPRLPRPTMCEWIRRGCLVLICAISAVLALAPLVAMMLMVSYAFK